MSDWLQRISNDSKTFSAKGGTELMRDALYKHTKLEEYENINLILSTPDMNKIRYTKHNLLWQHLSYTDESLAPLTDQAFMKSIGSQVYVSHWQYEKFRYVYQIPLENSYVIKNAIEPIENNLKEKDGKLKLIYASTPFRGLDIILDVFEILNRKDVELDVYSSTAVYGSGYASHVGSQYELLFDRARNMPGVNYKGYAPNEDIRKAMQEAHILAYPSIFEETSCLVMIEAGAAGCEMVTTNLGALYETGAEYAKMIPIQSDRDILIRNYAKALEESIDNYWNKSNQNRLKEQSNYYNKYYSWEKRSKEWNLLFEKISEMDSLVQKGHPSFG
jgi:glycosyltransferase involved in cell wall biosynthesis